MGSPRVGHVDVGQVTEHVPSGDVERAASARSPRGCSHGTRRPCAPAPTLRCVTSTIGHSRTRRARAPSRRSPGPDASPARCPRTAPTPARPTGPTRSSGWAVGTAMRGWVYRQERVGRPIRRRDRHRHQLRWRPCTRFRRCRSASTVAGSGCRRCPRTGDSRHRSSTPACRRAPARSPRSVARRATLRASAFAHRRRIGSPLRSTPLRSTPSAHAQNVGDNVGDTDESEYRSCVPRPQEPTCRSQTTFIRC